MKKAVEGTPEVQPDPVRIKDMIDEEVHSRLVPFYRDMDARDSVRRYNRDNALYILQVACWVIMLVGASLVAARALKQFKNSR